MPETRIAVTAGEPGGIGPDIAITLAGQARMGRLVVFADPELLQERAAQLGSPLNLCPYDPDHPPPSGSSDLEVWPISLPHAARCGHADPRLAPYVLACIDAAAGACLDKQMDALVTGPVQKSSLLDAGLPFCGHTEYLAKQAHSDSVMLLCAGDLRVALATTHVPLSQVPDQLQPTTLERTLQILIDGLRHQFAIDRPHIRVLGLNPHAGESGHLGREEVDVIAPTLARFDAGPCTLEGPVSADTAFVERDGVDAFLAMYHDQGLPVLKTLGFSQAVNVTLGLPYIRTSVDHGTALDRAGSGQANPGSLYAAIDSAAMQVQAMRTQECAA